MSDKFCQVCFSNIAENNHKSFLLSSVHVMNHIKSCQKLAVLWRQPLLSINPLSLSGSERNLEGGDIFELFSISNHSDSLLSFWLSSWCVSKENCGAMCDLLCERW